MSIKRILLGFENKKENILPVAKKIQKELGFVSYEAVLEMADYFLITPTAIYSTISFYGEIETRPLQPLLIKVCDGANCATKKSNQIIKYIERVLAIKVGDDNNPKVKLKKESCFGSCLAGPIVEINGTLFEKVTPEKIEEILKSYL